MMFTKDLSDVTSPPFDTIPRDMEAQLLSYQYNVLHLNSMKHHGIDTKMLMNSWIKVNILKKIEKPSIIFVLQSFKHNTESFQRAGIICLADIEDGSILPHENTIERFVMERKELMNHYIPYAVFLYPGLECIHLRCLKGLGVPLHLVL